MFITVLTSVLSLQLQEPEFHVSVDPRMEAIAVTMWLSGRYPSPADSKYKLEVWNSFKKFKNHPAVQALRTAKSIYPDMTELGVSITDWPNPKLKKTDLANHWRDILGAAAFDKYTNELSSFVKDSSFEGFFKKHEADYQRMTDGLKAAIRERKVGSTLAQFYRYRDGRQTPKFEIYLEPLNGWGAHAIVKDDVAVRAETGLVIQYQLGYLDGEQMLDLPVTFKNPGSVASLAWHEGSHVYVAPLFKKHKSEISKLENLFNKEDLASQNISTWEYCLNENTVRAITAVLILQTAGVQAYERELETQTKQRQFIYTRIIAELIRTEYVPNKAYANFDQFFPKILERLSREKSP